jgi:putative transposase
MVQPNQPRRRDSLRLSSWDYASPAWYFVTICTHRRKLLFGKIVDERMQLNTWGEIVEESWKWLADQYAFVSLDEYVIMPNHLHGVISLHPGGRGGSRTPVRKRESPLAA